ncbi:hypothetical protein YASMINEVIRUS_542 [Yasminevirus sp. GU-2018]|uniref:C2H2-type domain-containing protein n=1 Tax=Yasminevirus sp. GU-2018 TaxID=2420051 RepID=A0A5K0U7R5_9VIRU|nr:hypothetical protein YASMINEVIRUS_542 [Yasminevirus sp. GU-2018]
MSIHTCDACGQTFTRKVNLDYHIINQSCKIVTHRCKFCSNGFTTETSMYRHMRTSCKVKKEEDMAKEKIYGELVKIQEESSKKFIKMEEENKNLKKQVAEMQKQLTKALTNNKQNGTSIKTIKDSNVSINNGTVNNHNTNIMLVGYGNEDISKLNQSDILKVLQNGYISTVKLTEAVHFNPKYPEYHNVYISNMKDKYAMMFDGKNWTLTMKEDLINRIYEDKKNYIEENLEDFVDSLSVSRRKALERWLNTDDNDTKISDIKSSIKLLLYNSRRMPLSLIDQSDDKKNIVVPTIKTTKSRKLLKAPKITIDDNDNDTISVPGNGDDNHNDNQNDNSDNTNVENADSLDDVERMDDDSNDKNTDDEQDKTDTESRKRKAKVTSITKTKTVIDSKKTVRVVANRKTIAKK